MSEDQNGQLTWYRVGDVALLAEGRITTVQAGHFAVCLTRTEQGYGAISNRCPHQGGPLGDGFLQNGYVICPWHAYEYDPHTGTVPPQFDDEPVPAFPVDIRPDGVYVGVREPEHKPTLMDQMVETMVDWGVDTVFGMVGHSNLGLGDAFFRAAQAGRLRYFGIRHEGAAAFAASGYAKLTGRPAACFSIAGPGATNMLTGLWDAKVDRAPILALTGQVNTQVLGPGAFQEVPLAEAFSAVAAWSQTVLRPENAAELMALALKHALIRRDVGHLIFPDEVQKLPAVANAKPRPMEGRVSNPRITPPAEELERAVEMLAAAERPGIIVGNGGRPFADQILALAEKIDAPVITTFKAKGTIADSHPLACGVLGRSGTPIASATMNRSDVLLVLGASFSNHTSITTKRPIIQVDFDRMTLGKFHEVHLPLWGEIGATLELLMERLAPQSRPERRDYVARLWANWRAEKARRAETYGPRGRVPNAFIFQALGEVIPEDAVIAIDVGNNAYAFGMYFESKRQHVLMSGYLGSIGFAFPAAMGAWAAAPQRKIVAIAGDGGFGQYMVEFTTAVKYNMPITLVLLNNSELAKISREQRAGHYHVWQTELHNPNFAQYAEICGGLGIRVEKAAELRPALEKALAHEGPSLVEVISSAGQL
ncbi:MAG: thiamine pyrophosphate-dependent enzyme [Chloroflexi bacterium]|nr:thiamine pyrophosphate-dependent enzyme [Chloroflexota bacterium]MCI0577182.1 thiamine pyrophosphate-dependent enzyme [Chloroflexota bacterium]MCI0649250.1 thiamine pyrophosphate-dependent enzyme [Chloroflexota bacterium]MCI0730432.1 thiamine pyrophosphate-dependent enzyme [Chloroflexota bacterium]